MKRIIVLFLLFVSYVAAEQPKNIPKSIPKKITYTQKRELIRIEKQAKQRQVLSKQLICANGT